MTSCLSCSPSHVQDGLTALHIASSEGLDQIVELLLRREADVNHQIEVRLLMLVCVCSFMRSVIFFKAIAGSVNNMNKIIIATGYNHGT